ncbi:DUF952 domain-containing protein [Novosphingobium sp. 9]|uniref:DUF952 domain-containing protein n=1 Tax=Novosphingobium sp. 9 TaxID=2025349 RepID=UPI0021B67F33|nr:DUF952 domain-containing protein [Novosphingobium sp. 9]
MSEHPAVAYKILTAEQFAELSAAGTFAGAPVDLADGYIHLSAEAQVQGTLDKHFAGQSDLVIAAVDLAKVPDPVKWEVSRGGALFPHIYGNLPFSAVFAHGPATLDEAGNVVLPA